MNNPYALICVDVAHSEVDRLFHYAIPIEYATTIKKGMRVRVPFGLGNKTIIGYVMGFSDTTDGIPAGKIKKIKELCDDEVLFTDETWALVEWMRDKYYAPRAACLRLVAPPGKPTKRKKQPKPLPPNDTPPTLTGEQQAVVDNIIRRLHKNKTPTPVLLHGVTGSGKTEVYLHIIDFYLQAGRCAIVLVPEIALTPQTVGIFTGRFGDCVAVTHSRLSDGERFHIWKQALDGEIKVMIGPRSAVFAPFKKLGVIIIDEEHEHTYQSDLTPKYITREVAIKRAELNGGLVVMGSATPSLESYFKAQKHENGYILEELTERVNKRFPEVKLIDMRRELAEGNASLFARSFQTAIKNTLAAGEQIILFLNRRGHSTFVSCRWCGHVMSCALCRVNYTYHESNQSLICHYCGQHTKAPKTCPGCGSEFIRFFGAGTQKVEAEMAKLYPNAVCSRMDMDTTRTKHGHATILDAFRKGESQVLIGTQMIAKGLDFPRVTLVGVIAADMSLFTGDFRSAEHTFQLLTQVSGRSGRSENKGKVFIQTYNPEHYSLTLAQTADYKAFYRHEITIREAMGYPPFTHVFSVLATGAEEKTVIQVLHKLLAIMRYCKERSTKKAVFDIIGISPAFVSKIKNQYRWKLLVKAQDEEALKHFVLYCVRKLKENDPLTGIGWHLTLNPVMME